MMAAVGIVPTTLASGLRGALEGLDRFAASNASRVLLGVWMFVVPAWAVYMHQPQLGTIALYLVLGRCKACGATGSGSRLPASWGR